jgi:hypothetical protein
MPRSQRNVMPKISFNFYENETAIVLHKHSHDACAFFEAFRKAYLFGKKFSFDHRGADYSLAADAFDKDFAKRCREWIDAGMR